MKRVIRFQRTRYFFFAFSALLFAVGITFYVVNGGFNRGVDFKSGLAMQFQVAPASFSIRYGGEGAATLTVPAGEQALTAGRPDLTSPPGRHEDRHGVPLRRLPDRRDLHRGAAIPAVVTELTEIVDPLIVPPVRPATGSPSP
jgi:hypothetical protein